MTGVILADPCLSVSFWVSDRWRALVVWKASELSGMLRIHLMPPLEITMLPLQPLPHNACRIPSPTCLQMSPSHCIIDGMHGVKCMHH